MSNTSFSICRRAQARVPTFRVVVNQDETLYRGVDFTLAVYATDENGCHFDVSATVTLTLVGADASDALDDDGAALTTVSVAHGVWASTKVAVDGGSGPETGVTITADASGYVQGVSDSFSLFEYGVVDTFAPGAIAGDFRGALGIDSTYLWYAGAGSGDNLLRIALSDFSTYTAYSINTICGVSNPIQTQGMYAEGSSVYVRTADTNKIVCSIAKSDMTTFVIASDATAANSTKVLADSTYVYATNTTTLYKLLSSNLTTDTSAARRYDAILAQDTTCLYGVQYGTQTLDKILKSDLSVSDSVDLSAHITAITYDGAVVIDAGEEYLYVGSQDDDNIVKVQISDMSYVAKYESTANLDELCALGINGDYIYALGGNAQVVVKVKTSDMSLVWANDVSGTLSAFSNAYVSPIVFDTTHLYFGNSWNNLLVKMAQ